MSQGEGRRPFPTSFTLYSARRFRLIATHGLQACQTNRLDGGAVLRNRNHSRRRARPRVYRQRSALELIDNRWIGRLSSIQPNQHPRTTAALVG